MSTFLLNVSPNQNLGDAFAVQDLSGIHVWNLSDVSPLNQNPGAATAVNCIVNEVNDCVFRKICESLNKIWKFLKFFWKF